jgi:hypothetical protein
LLLSTNYTTFHIEIKPVKASQKRMKPPVWQLVAIVGMAKSPHLWYTGRKNLSVSFMDEHISMAMTEVVQGKRRSLSPLEDRTFARVLEVIALGWTTGCGD